MSASLDRLVRIMDRLRDPGGCPWDREQTLETLSGYLLEEAYETVDAIHGGSPEVLCEELGDLLLQIVFMARIAREDSWFDLDAVCDAIAEKMIRRHPHVFGDREVSGAGEVVRNWEEIKRSERGQAEDRSLLDGVPDALPGLLKAYRMTEKAAAVGFDWERPLDVVAKLEEEVAELRAGLAEDGEDGGRRVREEMGDLLFAMANLARHLGVEPETALQGANAKFRRRFGAVESRVREAGRDMADMDLADLDGLWDAVKEDESGADAGS